MARAKIMIVEDDLGWQQFYESILGEQFELHLFRDGVAALSAIDELAPAAVLLDIFLTGPTGFAVLNELCSYAELGDLPIMVVSSVKFAPGVLAKYNVTRVFDKATMHPRELVAALEGA